MLFNTINPDLKDSMEYFELPQLKVDNKANINAIDNLKENFKSVDLNDDGYQVTYEEGIPIDENKGKWMYYQDVDHGAEFNNNFLIGTLKKINKYNK